MRKYRTNNVKRLSLIRGEFIIIPIRVHMGYEIILNPDIVSPIEFIKRTIFELEVPRQSRGNVFFSRAKIEHNVLVSYFFFFHNFTNK